jgi:BolA protein
MEEKVMPIVADGMRKKLELAFDPATLTILDESHLHVGHHGHDGKGESHFAVTISAAAFTGKSRVERQRMVYAVLAEELAEQVHALRLTLKTPEEK